MKIKVFLFTFNRPDLLESQVKSLQKYLKDEFEIFVIHDSRDYEYVDEFKTLCETLEIEYFYHQSFGIKSTSQYHADSLNWTYQDIVPKYCVDEDVILFLDHDMFLIDELKLSSYFKNYDVVGLLQSRGKVNYIWPGLTSFKYSKVKNIDFDFNPKTVDGEILDTAGGTYPLLRSANIKFMDTKVEYPEEYNGIELQDVKVSCGYNYELQFDRKFLHSRNASCWHNNCNLDDANKIVVLKEILGDFL